MKEKILINFMVDKEKNIESKECSVSRSESSLKNEFERITQSLVENLISEFLKPDADYTLIKEEDCKVSLFEAKFKKSLRQEYDEFIYNVGEKFHTMKEGKNDNLIANFCDVLDTIINRLNSFYDFEMNDQNYLSPDLMIIRNFNFSDKKSNFINRLKNSNIEGKFNKNTKVSLAYVFPDNFRKENYLDATSSTDNKTNSNPPIFDYDIELSYDNYLIEIMSNVEDLINKPQKSEKNEKIPHKLRQMIEYSLYVFSESENNKNLLMILGNKQSSKSEIDMFTTISNCIRDYQDTFDYLEKKCNEKRKIIFMEVYFDDKCYESSLKDENVSYLISNNNKESQNYNNRITNLENDMKQIKDDLKQVKDYIKDIFNILRKREKKVKFVKNR